MQSSFQIIRNLKVNADGDLCDKVDPGIVEAIADVTSHGILLLPGVCDHQHHRRPQGSRAQDVMKSQPVVDVLLFTRIGRPHLPEDGAVYQ